MKTAAVDPTRIRGAWRVAFSLAGYSELSIDELVDRTVAVARSIEQAGNEHAA